jgi:hypothetical protein
VAVAEVEARVLERERLPARRGAVPVLGHSTELGQPGPALALALPERFQRRVVARRLERVAVRRMHDRHHSPTAGRRPRS